ncbi:VIR protein [Plasmodium vivax]|uniref:VIR protein n=1 Tax=Plasmodium vivax TaxID=5855 RepID=A0A1G4GSH9_PLAVI|nr:VIR protein [Plasmodium vivax]
MAGKTVTAKELEKAAKDVELDILYKEYFVKDTKKSTHDSFCDDLKKHDKPPNGPKELCSELVNYLEKISKTVDTYTRINHCNYLTYWLYDKIGGIYADHSKKTNDIPFFKDLIGVVDKVNKQIKVNTCTVQRDYNVSLDEWKKRKFSYIYLTKYHDIMKAIKGTPKDKCNLYDTYLKFIDILYKIYKKDNCKTFLLWSSGPNFADCSAKFDPNNFSSLLKTCGVIQSKGSGGLDSSARVSNLVTPSRSSPSGESGSRADVRGAPHSDVRVASLQPRAMTSSVGQTAHRDGAGTDISFTEARNALDGGAPVSTDYLQKTYDMLKSDYFRHALVGTSILGVIFFLFFYFKSTPCGSGSYKREKRKRKPGKNYYGENEQEFSRYESEQSVADSQMSDVHMSYQPRRDSYY